MPSSSSRANAPPATGRTYKIKLASGRILGPLDLDRVRLLILKNQITGTETAREYPSGDWLDINRISAIADLLVKHAKGELRTDSTLAPEDAAGGYNPLLAPTQVLPGAGPSGAVKLTETMSAELPELKTQTAQQQPQSDDRAEPSFRPDPEPEERTQIATEEELKSFESSPSEVDPEPTVVAAIPELEKISTGEFAVEVRGDESRVQLGVTPGMRRVADEATVVFQRSNDPGTLGGTPGTPQSSGGRRFTTREIIRLGVAIAAIAVAGQDLFFGEGDKKSLTKIEVIRPRLPDFDPGPAQAQESAKFYAEAMRAYIQDTVVGYKLAAEKLRKAAALDSSNVKALAMLASSYLNLIDSSNKDENYFSVLSKLIEMSRAKAVDLPETVIADVEFFITVNKPEAAQNRIVEYTKTHQGFGPEMFYYLGLSFYQRGDGASAARFLSQIPDNKVYTAKIFYLRGQVAERLGDDASAMQEYGKAFAFNKDHAKSRLKIAQLFHKQRRLQEAAKHLDFLVTHGNLLAPKDLALAYYLHGLFSQLYQKWDIALGDMERATKLDKDNSDYLLELFTLRAKAGDSVASIRPQARMYYFLGEGEKLNKEGKYQDALTQFLQARQADDKNVLPLLKIGDMFSRLNDAANALANYKLAADRAPNNIEVWSKYINALIQNYDWEEASKAMDKFRKLPVPQSAIDKAAADMYQKQGLYAEAQAYYRKAMGRDSIDSAVYIAYAKSLMTTNHFKEAPFFFALALRFDPLNIEALIGTAKSIAALDGIDRAIVMLQDELTKNEGAKSELLAAIAEFQIQRGEWTQAMQYVEQAKAANPEYAYPWKLEAQILMAQEGTIRGAVDKALAAYQSFSDRNASDPSGYLERYKLFIKKTEYEKASMELGKIYAVYPKYPNLHFYKGQLYSIQGNHVEAVREFKIEHQNNPSSVPTMLMLGKALVETGAVQEAVGIFTKAMQAQPKAAEPKHQAGYANYLLKNYPAAIALYQTALQTDSANPLLYKRLGVAYRDSGDLASAAQAFRKYLEMEPDAPDKAEFERFR